MCRIKYQHHGCLLLFAFLMWPPGNLKLFLCLLQRLIFIVSLTAFKTALRKPFSVSMKVFPERFKQRGETHPGCGWVASSPGWGGPSEKREEEVSCPWALLCLLAKSEHHLSSCFRLLWPHFPAIDRLHPQTVSQGNPLSLHRVGGYFVTAMRQFINLSLF